MASIEQARKVLDNAGVIYEEKTLHHFKVGSLNFYPKKETYNYDNDTQLGSGIEKFVKLVKDKHPIFIKD